ncbi:MAG: VTT domain-containing protein [Flavobacteriaceae bacterium]|nr:VTT domain-containing protein [Flavobacteriaceae bacterium]
MNDFSWGQLLNPEFYINFELGGIRLGIYVVLLIVFAETGLFAGFFLPGDSLLFLSGIYSRDLVQELFTIESDFLNVFVLGCLVSLAGIIGNEVGYWFGRKSGPFLYSRKDTLIFKKKYLFKARDFYEQYGGGTIIFARFLPIIRTFAPIVGGIVQMNKAKFVLFNIVGSMAWSFSLIFAGHYLYKFFLKTINFDLKEHIEIIVLGIVIVTTAPVLFKLFFGKSKNSEDYEDSEKK